MSTCAARDEIVPHLYARFLRDRAAQFRRYRVYQGLCVCEDNLLSGGKSLEFRKNFIGNRTVSVNSFGFTHFVLPLGN